MSALARELLSGILDYAGLFPPARLSMKDSVDQYLRYRNGPERWIVNRFLCPASRLAELVRHVPREQQEPIEVGVIGTGGVDHDAFQAGLEVDAQAMTAFESEHCEKASIEAYEVRLPAATAVEAAAKDLRAFDRADVFLELPWSASQSEGLAELAEQDWLGAKARTGGLEPSAYPSAEQLAGFLKGCQGLDLRFKLTAGLHRPLPHFDHEVRAQAHGFLNILAAMALNDANDLSTAEMARILEAKDVVWHDRSVSWNGFRAEAEDCEEVRSLFVGFGSCSVGEPLEGLAALGILEGAKR